MIRIFPGRRAGAALAAVLAAPLLLAGCQTDPTAAAIVGPTTISTNQLSSTVTAALRNSTFRSHGSDRVAVSRDELTRLVSQALIDQLARQHHVTVTSSEIATERSSLEQQISSQYGTTLATYYEASGVPAGQIPALLRSLTLVNQVATALLAGVPVSQSTLRHAYQADIGQFMRVHVAHILVHTKSLAERILAKVRKDPSSFAGLARKYSIDTGSAKHGGDLGTAAPTSYVAPFAKAAETAPVGSYVLVHSQYGWHVLHVISRTTESLAQATPSLKAQLLSSKRQALLTAAFQKAGKHVTINPRFGRWDDSSLEVVAAAPTTSRPPVSPSSAPASGGTP